MPPDPQDTAAGTAQDESDRPPILGSWGRMYLLVLFSLLLMVLAFAILTRVYS